MFGTSIKRRMSRQREYEQFSRAQKLRIKLTYNEETHSIIHTSMGNIVGSYETKYWWGTWIPVKESLVITPEQRAFLVGSLLGDGTMRVGEHAKNANYKVEQGLEQKEYVFWKYKLLKPLVFTEPKISYRYDHVKGRYPKSWWFRTIRHPLLTEIYDLFYERDGYLTGRKIVPETIAHELTPCLPCVMDDGSYSQGAIDLSTYSFTLAEINLLARFLKRNLELHSKLARIAIRDIECTAVQRKLKYHQNYHPYLFKQ